jgi:hypothetical protein
MTVIPVDVISNEHEKSFLCLFLLPTQLQDLSHAFEITEKRLSFPTSLVISNEERNLSFVFVSADLTIGSLTGVYAEFNEVFEMTCCIGWHLTRVFRCYSEVEIISEPVIAVEPASNERGDSSKQESRKPCPQVLLAWSKRESVLASSPSLRGGFSGSNVIFSVFGCFTHSSSVGHGGRS